MNETASPPPPAVAAEPAARFHAHLTPAAIIQLAGINLLWGGSSAAAKWGLSAFGPFTLATLRFLPGGILLWLMARYDARRSPEAPATPIRPADWPALGVLGLTVAITYGLFFCGLQQTNATDASLLFACEPLLLALFAQVFLKERLNLQQWGGLGLGLGGVWLIAGQSWGNRLALLALAVESGGGVLAKKLTHTMSGLRVIAWQLLIGSVLMLPLALREVAHHVPVVTWQAMSGLAYLCLVNTFLCYGIWYHLLNRFPVSTMGAFILLQPLVGPFYGYALQGDRLQWHSLAGGLLILVGIALTALRFPRTGCKG